MAEDEDICYVSAKTRFRTKGTVGVCPWLFLSAVPRRGRMFLAHVNAISTVNRHGNTFGCFDHHKFYEIIIDAGKDCLCFKTMRILNNKYSVSSALKQTHEYLSPQAHGYFNTAFLESI